MGCCNSNLHKSNRIEILVEERLIEASEKQLFFTNKKVEDLLSSIESINFPLDDPNFPTLCSHFHIQPTSPSGVFLHNLIQHKQLTVRVLRNLSIILSGIKSFDKFSLIFSLDKKVFLNTIQEILRLSIEVIPNHLGNLDKSVLVYAESLKPVAEEYLKELRRLSIEEIKDKVAGLEISSKDLRIKMYFDLKNLQAGEMIDSKFANFGDQFDASENREVREKTCSEERGDERVEEGKVDVVCLGEKIGENEVKVGENEGNVGGNEVNVGENEVKVEENEEKTEGSYEHSEKTDEKHQETEESPQKESKNPTDSESSYIKKIPESPDHLSMTEDSLIMPISELSQEKLQPPPEENLLEDPQPEESYPSEPLPIEPANIVNLIEEEKSPKSVKDSPKVENKAESKIPVRKSSGLAAKLKATQALIRSSTMGGKDKESNEIKIGLSSSQKNIALDKIKKGIKTGYSKEEFSVSSPIAVDPELAESSLLRSAQGKINSPSKNSKIGSFKSKK